MFFAGLWPVPQVHSSTGGGTVCPGQAQGWENWALWIKSYLVSYSTRTLYKYRYGFDPKRLSVGLG